MKLLLIITTFLIYNFSQSQNNFKGVGFQKDILEYWDLELTSLNDNNYQVEYPNIPCTANWIFIKKEKNYKMYKEELTSGFDNCKNSGIILVMNDDKSSNTKRFYIYDKEEDLEPYAFGFLQLIVE